MATGLVALLDDVAGLARLAAASLDDVAGATARVGAKAAGVVVDDTAVTPRYLVGLPPDRELPIVGRIGLGSLRNKLLYLLPGAIALSAVAPWAVTPLLMAGGAYLCFEATEKVAEALLHQGPRSPEQDTPTDARTREDRTVAGAIRTDLILSAEIMAISLAEVSDRPLAVQAIVLGLVGLAITVAVYGVVAVIVKIDDLGLRLAGTRPAPLRAIGRGLVRGMPVVLQALSVVGTAAMVWVGGGILLHGFEGFGFTLVPDLLHAGAIAAVEAVPFAGAAAAWVVSAAGAGVAGLVAGSLVLVVVEAVRRLKG